MKSLIAPVLIIVGLIVFFVLVDRKDFMRDDTGRSIKIDNPVSLASNSEAVPKMVVKEIDPKGKEEQASKQASSMRLR